MLNKDGEDQLDRSLKNEELLHRVKGERYILHTVKRKKVKGIGHIFRRKCLLKRVIEGNICDRNTRKKT